MCQFQVYSKMIQLYIYIYLFFFRFFSFVGYYKILSIFSCAVQQILRVYVFYIQHYLHMLCCSVTLDSLQIAEQNPLSMEFSSQEYWNGLPFPPLGDLPNSGIWPMSLKSSALADGSLPLEPLQFSHSVVSDFCNPTDCRLPCPSTIPRACLNSHPSSQ